MTPFETGQRRYVRVRIGLFRAGEEAIYDGREYANGRLMIGCAGPKGAFIIENE
jgi:hypothetical protein